MTEYEISPFPEFSAIKSPNGNIYHLKGAYRLHTQQGSILPVNRSYSLDENGNRVSGIDRKIYRRNRLIHEDVSRNSFVEIGELLIDVYNKPLLFLQDNQEYVWYSTYYESNTAISSASKRLANGIKEKLLKADFAGDYNLGVYGSHQAGLNSVDSDLDLIAWVKPTQKTDFLDLVNETFISSGYVTTKETGKDAEYAVHYSRKFNIPVLAGRYLANKRMRWISPEGVSTSLQCLNIDHNDTPIRDFLSGMHQDWKIEEVVSECQVLSAADCYNFPKTWDLVMGDKHLNAISFSWAHQGMGDDNHVFGDTYLFRGTKVTVNHGDFLFMQNNDHYLIPIDLL